MFDKVVRHVMPEPGPIRELMHSLGAGNALLYGVHRALQAIHSSCSLNSYYLVAQPVAAQALLPGSRGASIAVRFVEPGDRVLDLMNRSRNEIAARFAGPGVCLVAEKQDRMVGFLWLVQGRYQEPDDHCVFVIDSPQVAWDLDVFVEPSLRLSPVFARLWSEANIWLRERGIAWTLSRISCYNERSLQSHVSLGLRILGRMTFLKLGAIQIMFSGLSPYIHFKVGSRDGPEIRLLPPEG
jgi:hypothetical protein